MKFSDQAQEDYNFWKATNPKILARIHELMRSVQASPFKGIGKPEPLRHALSGYWSRRITDEHRMVYTVREGVPIYIQFRYHYGSR